MDISYKGELQTTDGKISTTLLILLIPSFSEKLKNKYSAEMVACWWAQWKHLGSDRQDHPFLILLCSQSLMHKRKRRSLCYHHVACSSSHCWPGTPAWQGLVTTLPVWFSRQRPLTKCWMKLPFIFHFCKKTEKKHAVTLISPQNCTSKQQKKGCA